MVAGLGWGAGRINWCFKGKFRYNVLELATVVLPAGWRRLRSRPSGKNFFFF